MNSLIKPKLRPIALALRNTIYRAALLPVTAMLPIATHATIIVPPGNPGMVQYTSTGITPPPQTVTGQNGQNGGVALDYSVELQNPIGIISGGGTSPALVYLSSSGGNGGGGGPSMANFDENGPYGGNGAIGGNLSVIFDAPTSASTVANLQNGQYPAVSLLSQGGNAGYGYENLANGNGGIGGLGANGGDLGFTVLANPSYPSALNFIAGDTAAVSLTTIGGNGGDSGASKSYGGASSVTGRAGNNAGNGGNIIVNTGGYIDGTNGSGITALSQGGNGGQGGDASASGASVTGANGGYAGNGGNINITVTGGNITAHGSKTLQTGESQQFDSSTNPLVKVMLDTTLMGAGIEATSQGGVGGNAGTVDGFVTHGANGAKGGDAGLVSISLQGSSVDALSNNVLATDGYNTFGAMALSIGGDGGNGNSGNGVFFSSGGNGGTGGNGGEALIKVSNDTAVPYALITTTGEHSDALVAMSVGGGGGVSGSLSDRAGELAFDTYIGAVGGNGGDADTASIFNGYYDNAPVNDSPRAFHPGDVITTTGNSSRGMIAQSVGGGGGLGGDAINTAIGASLAIGGNGGAGGNGELAQVANFSIISTEGMSSDGILAQSVGGGGGIGGEAMSKDISAQIGVSLAIGGSGGVGGNAGEADAYNLGQIQTYGGNAHGIFAQAIGGGGGTGGSSMAKNYTTSMPDEPSLTVTTAIGGKGGAAGDGGGVIAVNDGLLQTQGQDAYGVFAESVGGGGGYGGDASTTSMAFQQAKFTIGTTIGGDGAAGGKGGSVKVWNSGVINTTGAKSIGVFAQSVGGGGGAGGSGTADQGGVYQGGGYSLQLTTTIGGQGGAAGNGGDVLVNNYVSSAPTDKGYLSNTALFSDLDLTGHGAILTMGDMAAGIHAQSVGGGGGNGGDSTGKGSNGQINANIAIGGRGGAGGDGGDVTVHNGNGAISTYGAQSYGIIAQSVGGGGGTGGNATTGSGNDPEYSYPRQAAVLKDQKQGFDPNSFTEISDNVWDWKDNIKGFWDDLNRLDELAAVNAMNSSVPKPQFNGIKATDLTVDVGAGAAGGGGASGIGGTINVDSYGGIQTRGPMAFGIFGQSVGGGGGVGGATQASTANDRTPNSVIEAAVNVGGADSANGSGGEVTIQNMTGAKIITDGDMSFGIFGQSVGGGGGLGGASMSSQGLASAMSVTLGNSSDQEESSKGGEVDLTNAGQISTYGDNATGMFAQSVGGGGGISAVTGQEIDSTTGLSYSTTQSLASGKVNPQILTSPVGDYNKGGMHNTGGVVNVTQDTGGAITTSGINAFGMLAQSIGGGGGLFVIDPNNQVTVAKLVTPDSYAPLLQYNDAGTVTVTTQYDSSITTTGEGAAGIMAQSLGGGGAIVNGLNGINLMSPVQTTTSSRQMLGSGGNITIDNSANITTSGAYAHGVFAQAATGAGGAIGRSDGTGTLFSGVSNILCTKPASQGGNCGGAVTANLQTGAVLVSGLHSWGVALESLNVAIDESGDVSTAMVNVSNSASVIATGKSDGAILLNASGANTVVNAGTIDGSTSAGGYAIYDANGKHTSYNVTNQATGIIEGSFGTNCKGNCFDTPDSASLKSSIINKGLIASGDVVDLSGGMLENSGTLMVQGTKTGVTALNGDYQGPGKISLDADYSHSTGDSLTISGHAAVSGALDINPVTMHKTQIAVLTADKGLTLADNASTTRTELFTTSLEQKANTLYATPEAHFVEKASDMDAASRTVASHLQEQFDAGVDMDDSYTSLAKVGSNSEYNRALHSITGRTLGSVGAFRFQSSRDFVSNLNQGCEKSGMVEGNCTWGRVQTSGGHQDDSQASLGYHANAVTYEVGMEHAMTDQLTVGAAIGYERSDFDDDEGLGSVDGNSVLVGAGLTYETGPYALSGALDGAYGSYKSTRTIAVGDQQTKAFANPDVWSAGLHLKGSYTKNIGDAYIRPFVELQGVQVHGYGYTEHGSSSFNLAVDEQSKFSLSEGAGVEFGKHVPLRNGAELSFYVNSAIETTDGTNWETRAKFADSPSSDKFDVNTNVPSTYGRFGAGVKLTKWKNVDVTLSYNPEIGSGYHSNNAIARVDWKF